MPLAGGPADKLGNRFELQWTVRQLVNVLVGQATSIRLEPPGHEGEGIEFWLECPSGKEFHQVKRQRAGSGRWSATSLKHVLRSFQSHLDRHRTARCVFVSMDGAGTLRDLAEDHAQRASSLHEFETHFLNTKSKKDEFNVLCSIWNDCEREAAWRYLRRINFRMLDERSLRDDVISMLRMLTNSDAEAVADALAMHALESLHDTLNEQSLWSALNKRGHRPSNWSRDASVALTIKQITHKYLEGETALIERLKRIETDQVIEPILADKASSRRIFLIGNAGYGKSGVAAQVVEKILDRGWPVLAFRLDKVELARSPDELGRTSGLNLPGSPVSVLAAVACGKPSLLVLDQLDAVSSVSGTSAQFMDCFAQLARDALAHPELRVLVVCRSFDLRHDARLRRFKESDQNASEITVGVLNDVDVQHALESLGVALETVTGAQREILRVPLHLTLFAESVRADSQRSNFRSSLDLFEFFWQTKRDIIRRRGVSDESCVLALNKLASQISERRELSIHRDRLLQHEAACNALVSEHVLRRDDYRIGFFHQSFFDYWYGRLFTEGNQQLSELVLSDEQHLFRRGQIRQILLYQRATGDRDSYLKNIRWLLTDNHVRFHLAQVAFLVLAGHDDPGEDELLTLLAMISDKRKHYARWSRRALGGSAGWLRLLNREGLIDLWLGTDEAKRKFAIGVIVHWAAAEPEIACRIFAELVNQDDEATEQLWWIVSRHPILLKHPEFADLIEKLARRQYPPDHVVWRMATDEPELGILLVRQRLIRLLRADPQGLTKIADKRHTPYSDLAQSAPVIFLRAFAGPVLFSIARCPSPEQEGRALLSDRLYWTGQGDFRESDLLFDALASAMGRELATGSKFADRFSSRLEKTSYRTAHLILCKAWSAAGAGCASRALTYVQSLLRRYGNELSDHVAWELRALLDEVSTGWSEAQLTVIASEIINVRPSFEYSKQGYRWRGRTERMLLEGLPTTRLSRQLQQRLQELIRRPGTEPGERPERVRGGFVEAPLSETAAAKMSDREWLGAFRRYHSNSERLWLNDQVFGGARELATLFQSRVKQQPTLFASLCLRFPMTINMHYNDAILMGLKEADGEIGTELLQAVIERCHLHPARPHGRWIVRLLDRYADDDLPDSLLQIVCWYATNDPDPSEELARKKSATGEPYYSGDIHSHGFNTTRGAAAETLASLIRAKPERYATLEHAVNQLLADPIMAVRSCAIEILGAILPFSASKAIELFIEATKSCEELLVTRPADYFLWRALTNNFDRLRPIVEHMMLSDNTKLAEAGARHASLAAFDVADAEALSKTALAGAASQRLGCARVYANNVMHGGCRKRCMEILLILFHDEDGDVRGEAARWIGRVDARSLADFEPLILDMIASPSFNDATHTLFHVLKDSTASLPKILFRAIERFAALHGAELRNGASAVAHIGGEVAELLMRAYTQERDPTSQSQCLDLIDELIKNESFGLDNALAENDR